MRASGAQIDGFEVVDGQWQRDGRPLRVGDHVTVTVDGGPVYAVNPITMKATRFQKVFSVKRIDGTNVDLHP